MPPENQDLPAPVNHIFVDFENVHDVDLSIIGNKNVHLTLLLGARQTKLDTALVEQFLRHASTVEMIRLSSSGRNALDFALAYYLGRAALTDPCGRFYIVSKDTGYDPLIEHLRSKNIHAGRHDDFTTLPFSTAVKPPARLPASVSAPAAPKPKTPPKTKVQPVSVMVADEQEKRALEFLRKQTTTRPRTKTRLLSSLIAHLGHKMTEGEASNLVENLTQAGHLVVDDNGKVTYYLTQG